MEIDPVKLAARLNVKPEKRDATFKITTEIYSSFRSVCERMNLKPSHVIDEFMREFCEKLSEPVASQGTSELSPARRELLGLLAPLDESQVATRLEMLRAELAAGAGQKRKKAK